MRFTESSAYCDHCPAARPSELSKLSFDRAARQRRTVHRAVEDHVLHRIAAQRRGARLAEHPAKRVDHVRLATAVRPDNADELAGNMNRCGIYEGLKTRQLYLS